MGMHQAVAEYLRTSLLPRGTSPGSKISLWKWHVLILRLRPRSINHIAFEN